MLLWLVGVTPARANEGPPPAGTGKIPAGTDVTTGEAERVLPVEALPTASPPAAIQPQGALESHAGSGINIVWTNRGPGDGFDTIFTNPATANLARANVDAAIDAWEQVITTLNRPSDPSDTTLEVTVNMNAGSTATSCGGSANGNFDGDGWPTGGAINVNGNAGVWFIDTNPLEHSEFSGNIDNAFSGDTQSGSPAAGLCDMFTLVGSEIIHILGITSDGGSRFQTGGFNQQLTMTGTTCSGPGDLWQFTGATVTALMTSNNGGNSGSDFGVPVHSAEPCASFGGLSGANDGGNALFEGSRRYLPANLIAFILKDTYNFGVVAPESFGTFYSVLNQSTGNLLVRGGDDNDISADVISITRSGGEVIVSVDVGNDIPGTGPTDAFVSRYHEGEVQSITVNALDGNDGITVSDNLGIPLTVNGGDGNDNVEGSSGNDVLNGDDGNDTVIAKGGVNTVTDGTGNDVVDLSQNSIAINYSTGGGNDTVVGSVFNDTITGSSGSDTLIAGPGDDILEGGGGSDDLFGEGGSDRFLWDTGDGSDLIEGGSGVNDSVEVSGSAGGEFASLAAAPQSRVDLDVNGSSLDIADVEDYELDLGGGNDDLNVTNLSTTVTQSIGVDVGTGTDSVTVVGTGADDTLGAAPGTGDVQVSGLPYSISVSSSGSDDTLTLAGAAGNDTVVVSGSQLADLISVDGLSGMSGAVAGAVDPRVEANAESLVVDGVAGADSLVVETPSGSQTITLTPGAAPDGGSITSAGLIPVEYRRIPASVEFDDPGGRLDRLIYNGTTEKDTFDVQSGSGVIALDSHTPVTPTGIADLELRGLAADDDFSAAAILPFTTTLIHGGDSVAGDSLSLVGAGGAVTVDLGVGLVTGYGGSVQVSQVEALSTSQTGAAGTDLTVLGTAGDDAMTYTPTGAESGLVTVGGLVPGLAFSGAAGTFTTDPVGGTDDVIVVGTNAADTVTVVATATTTVQANSTKTVEIPQASTEIVSVTSLDGADFIDFTTFDDVSMFFKVDGGSPSSKLNSDEMHVTNGTGQAKDVKFLDEKSFVKGSGSVMVEYKTTGEATRIDYLGIEDIRFFRN
jgi:Ca2+-binding RTX toxin-like protein